LRPASPPFDVDVAWDDDSGDGKKYKTTLTCQEKRWRVSGEKQCLVAYWHLQMKTGTAGYLRKGFHWKWVNDILSGLAVILRITGLARIWRRGIVVSRDFTETLKAGLKNRDA